MVIGEITQDQQHSDPFLHFSMVYSGTWETNLKKRTSIPHNAGASWIKERYQILFNLMSGGFGGPPSGYAVT